MPKAIIIIPNLNSPLIAQVLTAVFNQEEIEQVSEILVIGRDESGLIKNLPKVRFIETEEPVAPGVARNLGIQSTDARLLIFLDSDCIPQPGWLAQHLRTQAAGHNVVGGGILPKGNSYWHLVYNLTLFHKTFATAPPGKRDFLPTLNLSVNREVIEVVGMINENLPRGEDVDWTTRMRRAGYQPYFQPAAAVYHQHDRRTLTAVWADCANSGFYMRQVRLRHANTLQTPTLLRYPWLVLMLSPFIATWITLRIIVAQPALFARFIHLIPAIYLTKIAWCWGAGRSRELE